MCLFMTLVALVFGTAQSRQASHNPQKQLQVINFRYFPQRSAELVAGPKKGEKGIAKLGGLSTAVTDKYERAGAATANGKFAYISAGSFAYISQYRVGNGGVVQPLKPATLDAHSHPTAINFHPTGSFLYVTCSHGAICQYRLNPNGVLTPLKPLEVYGEHDPSPLRFDRTGRYALVVTEGIGGRQQADVYRVLGNGTLKLDRRLAAENLPINAKSIDVRGGEVVVPIR